VFDNHLRFCPDQPAAINLTLKDFLFFFLFKCFLQQRNYSEFPSTAEAELAAAAD
jgi:hypothetical protein